VPKVARPWAQVQILYLKGVGGITGWDRSHNCPLTKRFCNIEKRQLMTDLWRGVGGIRRGEKALLTLPPSTAPAASS
jgi:hypothetical protein